MKEYWNILPPPPTDFLEKHPELPTLVSHLLYHRDIVTQEQIDEFLHPDYSRDIHDPFLFVDMQKAVDRIFEAMEKKQKITIHGDYDADGVSGSVILSEMFEVIEYPYVDVFLPHRDVDGYGLNSNTIQNLHKQETKLIISCDCGISNAQEVILANELGIDVIITDHHSIPAILPPAYAIIHPKLDRETYPGKNLAGGAVAFKLMQGVLKQHKKTHQLLPNGNPHDVFEKWMLDMVAIASVADMVPLLGESRTLTKYGLLVLNKTKKVGLQKLFLETRIMQDDGTLKYPIDAETIGFKIAPRINAAGRIGHANLAYKLLVEKEPTQAVNLAFQLDQNNKERQELTKELVEKGLLQIPSQIHQPILFVIGEKWPPGLVGLISGTIKNTYKKPTIVMSRDKEIMGSGRSITGFNFVKAMQDTAHCFSKFGGHPMAGGFTLAPDMDVETFKKELIAQYKKQEQEHPIKEYLDIDAEINIEDINWELYDTLEKFQPFGQGNQKPKYLARGAKVIKIASMGADGTHLNLSIQHTTLQIKRAVGWSMCKGAEENLCALLKPGDTIDIIFEISVNEWNGNRDLQIILVDVDKVSKKA